MLLIAEKVRISKEAVVTKDISQYSLEEGEENNVNCHLAEI
jgi:hypothetical protein